MSALRQPALALLAIIVAAVALTCGPAHAQSTSCAVSKSRFTALQTGMGYCDVVLANRVLGCQGEEVSRAEMGGFLTVGYAWKGAGRLGANMNAVFQNDRLVSKA